MTALTWGGLFLKSLRSPHDAAEIIVDHPVSARDVYLGVIAGAALNALIWGGTTVLFPLPEEWPAFMSNPVLYFILLAGGLLMFAHLLTWAGRAMGGHGDALAILKLMAWLQIVRVGLQVIGLVLMIALPLLGSIYYIAVSVLSLWILLQFVKVGHDFPSLGRAAVALFFTFVGLVVGLSVVLALLGAGQIGALPDV